MHPTDDLQARGALMEVRAAAKRDDLDAYWREFAHIGAETLSELQGACEAIRKVRSLSASDAALARAIDAVPGAIGGADALVIRSNGARERI